ncbi:MAG: ethanolamine ammonia-lyase subunit EutB [Clostridiales bacterium]
MKLKANIYGRVFAFHSVAEVLAKANEVKSGDTLLGVGATSQTERVAAKLVLSRLTLEDIYENPVIPYEKDEVTRIIYDDLNMTTYNKFKNCTIGGIREFILAQPEAEVLKLGRGMTSEMIAGVAKLMSNMDLVAGAAKLRPMTRCNTTMGLPGTVAYRNQPNHTTDDVNGIMASMKEGFTYGAGDAVIGINPVEDNPENTAYLLKTAHEFMDKWEIPTQACVLAHVTTQMKAQELGAPIDVFFQSIAGTQKTNEAFGIDAALLHEAHEAARLGGTSLGPNFMYFETGQGSEESLEADEGIDEMTLEARTYGFGRHFSPFMVNNVSGFIGPETIYDGREIVRADLEDLFMGKLHGLPMGIAPCYTNHMNADQNDQEIGTMLCAMAGSFYFMGVPGGDDVMLNYQDTSYHDDATVREVLGLRPLPEFEKWMEKMGLMEDGHLTPIAGDPSIFDK